MELCNFKTKALWTFLNTFYFSKFQRDISTRSFHFRFIVDNFRRPRSQFQDNLMWNFKNSYWTKTHCCHFPFHFKLIVDNLRKPLSQIQGKLLWNSKIKVLRKFINGLYFSWFQMVIKITLPFSTDWVYHRLIAISFRKPLCQI